MLIRDLRLFNATRARQLNCFHFPHLTNKPNQKPFRTSQNIYAKNTDIFVCSLDRKKNLSNISILIFCNPKRTQIVQLYFLFVDFDCKHNAVQHTLNEHEFVSTIQIVCTLFFCTTFYMTIWNSQLSTLNVTMRMDWIGLDWYVFSLWIN